MRDEPEGAHGHDCADEEDGLAPFQRGLLAALCGGGEGGGGVCAGWAVGAEGRGCDGALRGGAGEGAGESAEEGAGGEHGGLVGVGFGGGFGEWLWGRWGRSAAGSWRTSYDAGAAAARISGFTFRLISRVWGISSALSTVSSL